MKQNQTIIKLVCAVGIIGFLLLFYFGKEKLPHLLTGSEQVTDSESELVNATGREGESDQPKEDANPETANPEGNDMQNPIREEDGQATPKTTPEPTPEPTLHPTDWDYTDIGYVNMPYPEDEPAEEFPYEIRINKQCNAVTIYERNKNGKYKKPVKAMVCSVGSATPIGTFQLKEKYYWKALIHGVWGQYSTRITGRVLFHSVPYSEPKKDKLMANLYRQLGSTASAGCVRLTTIDAKWILENCPTGTTVVIYNSNDPGPLGKPKAPSITTTLGWDPTDPDTRNPLNLKKSQLKGVKDRTVERGSSINYMNGVVAFDKPTMTVSDKVKIKTDLNVNKVGSYLVRYVFTDSKGKKIKKEATFTVRDTTPPQFSGIPSTYYIQDAKEGSKKSLLSRLTVTDNGSRMDLDGLTVNMPDSIKKGTNSVKFFISDEFGNVGTFTCHVVLVTKPPVLTFKPKNKDVLPITQKVNMEFAKTRVTLKDEETNMSLDDIKIDVVEKNWGYKIKYTATNKAGYSTSISETVTYETYRLEVDKAKVKNASSIRKQELLSYVKVKSDMTNKTVDAKVQVKTKWMKKDDDYKYYTATYHCTYKSPVGKKTETEKVEVRLPVN